MPEALAIVAVFFIAVAIVVGMWVRTRNPALHRPQEELERMRHHATWLEERLARAQRENWGHEMIAGIEAERETTQKEIARVGGG